MECRSRRKLDELTREKNKEKRTKRKEKYDYERTSDDERANHQRQQRV
jgi:hypothetical protein